MSRKLTVYASGMLTKTLLSCRDVEANNKASLPELSKSSDSTVR